MSSGQRLLVARRNVRNTFALEAPFEGKSRKTNCLAAWGTFCKRKSSQQTSDSHNSEKPPGGRFFWRHDAAPKSRIGYVQSPTSHLAAPSQIPRRKTAKRLFRGPQQETAKRLSSPRGTAQRLPRLLPAEGEQRSAFPRTPSTPSSTKKGAACQPAGCSFSVSLDYFSGWKAGSAPSRSPASADPQR